MTYADDLLQNILEEVQVTPETISEAKTRRTAVLDAAATFDGCLRTYRSGSLEYGTEILPPPNKPDKGVDGDGGMVLNRQVWTTLGPDSSETAGPTDVVEQVKDHIRPKLKETYPKATISTTAKRAISITVHEPLSSGEDPQVELIVALTRKTGTGLWIPNLIDDAWDAADPEKHRKLINDDPKASLRQRRRRAMRLIKHWNKRHTKPAFSSFHLQALALECITDDDTGTQMRTTLQQFFERAADSLAAGDTPDPAGVSGNFHLENDITKDAAVSRLRDAGNAFTDANAKPDDADTVYDAYEAVFHCDTVKAADAVVERSALVAGNVALGGSKAPRAWRNSR